MKKIFITIIMIFTLCMGAYAKHTPLYKNSISIEGIGAIQLPNEFTIYEKPDLKSKVLTQYKWGQAEGSYVNDDYGDNFIVFDPVKNIGFMTVVEDSELEGWYEICYDQTNKLTGWVYPKEYKFYPWLSLFTKYGKANGLYAFRDLDNTEKRLYAKADPESQVIGTFKRAKDIRIQIIRGNWALVRLYDYERKMKIGWIRWRTDEGKFQFFPNVIK